VSAALDVRKDMRKTLRMTVRTRVVDGTYEPNLEPRRVPVNLSLPEDLVAALDEVAGPRKRSAFAEEALRRAVRREKFRIAGERYAGSLKFEDYPHWRTSEDVAAWVRMMRAEETSTDVGSE
jgi:predicted transcriptional regulator